MRLLSPRAYYHAVGKKAFWEFLLLAAFLLFFYLPILNLVMLSFGEKYEAPAVFPQQYGFKWWGFVLGQPNLVNAIVLSLVFAVVTTLISMIICLPAAYALARFEFPGRRAAQLSLIPFSAVIARDRFDACGDASPGHYTHEKNPLGAAVALEVLETIKRENLLARAEAIGTRMEARAEDMMARCPLIGDVRRIGALMGIELVRDRESKEKAEEAAERALYNCLEGGLSFKVSQGNVLTLAPPLTATDDEIDRAMDIVGRSIFDA